MKGLFYKILIALILLLGPAYAHSFDLKAQVTEFKLKNGMKWLIVTRKQAPVFSGIIMVRVGGADEEMGKTGLAHMFEHMAFKGSSRIGTHDWSKEKPVLDEIEKIGTRLTALRTSKSADKKEMANLLNKMKALKRQAMSYQIKNEVWEILMRNGAKELNAYTSKDITAYHASMPAECLELWARVTAEMIFDPAFRDFYTERSVVEEERRTGVENDPEGALTEKLLSSAYNAGPYSWMTHGFKNDLEGLAIEDARQFHTEHYVPSNIVGVIVGDIRPSNVKRVIKRVFDGYPKRPEPKQPRTAGQSSGDVYVRMRFDAEPAIAIAFHKPTLPDKSEYIFDVIAALLCDGRSSRLEKRLIYDERLAKDVYCSVGFPGSRFDNLFLIWIEPIKGVSLGKILDAVHSEISQFRKTDVSAEDLSRVHKQVTSSIMFALDSNENLAEALARFQSIFGDWRLLADYPSNIAHVNAADVQSIAQKYLVKDNRVIVERLKGR